PYLLHPVVGGLRRHSRPIRRPPWARPLHAAARRPPQYKRSTTRVVGGTRLDIHRNTLPLRATRQPAAAAPLPQQIAARAALPRLTAQRSGRPLRQGAVPLLEAHHGVGS